MINKKNNLSRLGSKNGMWKGNKVGYAPLHQWVEREKGKATYCQNNLLHKAKRFEWANVSGKYKRDIKDYIQLCPSCHRKRDYTEEQKLKQSISAKKRWETEKPSEALMKWRNRGKYVVSYL